LQAIARAGHGTLELLAFFGLSRLNFLVQKEHEIWRGGGRIGGFLILGKRNRGTNEGEVYRRK